MITEKEIEFLDKIDCNFPYLDRKKCVNIINEANSISSNATFSVIDEICRIPQSERAKVSNETLFELLYLLKSSFKHPLKSIIIETAKKIINNELLEIENVILAMNKIREFKGQYAALSILYFSCDDEEGKLEIIWNEIINEWNFNVA